MKKKLSSLILLLITMLSSLAGCSGPIAHSPMMPEPILTTKVALPDNMTQSSVVLGDFDKIILSGHVYANLRGQQAQNRLTIQGFSNSLKNYSISIRHKTLYIGYGQYPLSYSAKNPLIITLDITKPVRQLTFNGSNNAQLTADNISDQSMDLRITGNSIAKLKGNLVLSHVNVLDNAVLYGYWVNSSDLHILLNQHAQAFLAGLVDKLDVSIQDYASLTAKYLHTKDAYIQSFHHASANVSVKHVLSVISHHQSNVYYYQDSDFVDHYLSVNQESSVLRMTGIQ